MINECRGAETNEFIQELKSPKTIKVLFVSTEQALTIWLWAIGYYRSKRLGSDYRI